MSVWICASFDARDPITKGRLVEPDIEVEDKGQELGVWQLRLPQPKAVQYRQEYGYIPLRLSPKNPSPLVKDTDNRWIAVALCLGIGMRT